MSRTVDVAVPSALNLLLCTGIVAANAAIFFLLPMALAGAGPLTAGLAIGLVLTTIPHWALVHEAIHGHLHPDRRLNDALGRLLAILFCAPFENLKFGHLSHHALNARAAERPEFYDPGETSRWRASLVYYARLCFGLFAFEMASSFLALLPRRWLRPIVRRIFYDGNPEAGSMADRAERQLLEPERLGRIRVDAVLIIGLLAGSLWVYGAAWPLLAAVLGLRAFLVSFMDNAPHYQGPLASPDQGYDMAATQGVRLFVLNSNFHGVHHTHPNLPWTALPEAFSAEQRAFHGHYLTTPWRQLRGPVGLPTAASTMDATGS